MLVLPPSVPEAGRLGSANQFNPTPAVAGFASPG